MFLNYIIMIWGYLQLFCFFLGMIFTLFGGLIFAFLIELKQSKLILSIPAIFFVLGVLCILFVCFTPDKAAMVKFLKMNNVKVQTVSANIDRGI